MIYECREALILRAISPSYSKFRPPLEDSLDLWDFLHPLAPFYWQSSQALCAEYGGVHWIYLDSHLTA